MNAAMGTSRPLPLTSSHPSPAPSVSGPPPTVGGRAVGGEPVRGPAVRAASRFSRDGAEGTTLQQVVDRRSGQDPAALYIYSFQFGFLLFVPFVAFVFFNVPFLFEIRYLF
ncbi:hypothetical protein NL676_038583 [Syzygium grande]|nr:hypothetical protein NL676_038583 [Syzygium grande]